MKILDTLKKFFISNKFQGEATSLEESTKEQLIEEKSNKEKTDKEDMIVQQQRHFQWIKGDNVGKISTTTSSGTYEEDGIYYLDFTDGSRINTQLINEYVVEIPSINEPIINKEDMVLAPKPPKVTVTTAQKKEQVQLGNTNPIIDLLSKARHRSSEITITLDLELPSEDLIKVIMDSYGEDGKSQIFNYLIGSLKKQDIHELLVSEIWKQIYGKE